MTLDPLNGNDQTLMASAKSVPTVVTIEHSDNYEDHNNFASSTSNSLQLRQSRTYCNLNSFTYEKRPDHSPHEMERFNAGNEETIRMNNRYEAQYRRLQSRIYDFLERPKSCLAITYHLAV
ncbi:hypothetical protein Ciccas_000331 [Cichlidogyrus casuarinus]|uniref:Uncharacterized protein n=1 Tax=Cichlidogyrus casuarinus TaxID=1844966 RepID=A0ABD2QN93_9PLAT